MFALSNGLAKFQCSISTETVEVYRWGKFFQREFNEKDVFSRSVNFTPSWGKRSLGGANGNGNREVLMPQPRVMALPSEDNDKCLSRGLYLGALFENLKVIFEISKVYCTVHNW